MMAQKDQLTVALVQMAPVWLRREASIGKMLRYIHRAGEQGCDLVVFGEALIPGYPFWVELTDGARFNSKIQKEMHAYYMEQAIQTEVGHLDELCAAARQYGTALMTGSIERAPDRGGHCLFCSLIYITAEGEIANVHRKLMPTYEERLTWAQGDGYGLRTFPLGAFTVGGLNCWENWMPLPRAALYALGEDLHIALWPGNLRNTDILTPFLAREGRSYVISVSGLIRRDDFPENTPHLDLILQHAPEVLADGGSCIARPDGSWLLEPFTGEEGLRIATLDHAVVREERQNFDPSGHYARPDVTRLTVNRERQQIVHFRD